MPLFAAVLVVTRRRRRSEVRAVPVALPPLHQLLADEARVAWRSLRGRLWVLIAALLTGMILTRVVGITTAIVVLALATATAAAIRRGNRRADPIQ